MAHRAVEERVADDAAAGAASASPLADLRVADDELPDVDQSLPLHKAAFFGKLEEIRAGTVDFSDVDARDRWGLTALHWAVIGKCTAICAATDSSFTSNLFRHPAYV
jgi:ankyrin repeat protein